LTEFNKIHDDDDDGSQTAPSTCHLKLRLKPCALCSLVCWWLFGIFKEF